MYNFDSYENCRSSFITDYMSHVEKSGVINVPTELQNDPSLRSFFVTKSDSKARITKVVRAWRKMKHPSSFSLCSKTLCTNTHAFHDNTPPYLL